MSASYPKSKLQYDKAIIEIDERLKVLEGFEIVAKKSPLTRDQKFVKDITMMIVEQMMEELPLLKKEAEKESLKK